MGSPFGANNPDQPTALAIGLYRLILDRAATAEDMVAAVAKITLDGGNPVPTAAFLMGCPEARMRDVANLYQAFLGRAPDDAGLMAFAHSSQSYEQIALDLIGSEEFLGLAALSVAAVAIPAPVASGIPAELRQAINQARAANGNLPPMVDNPILQTRLAQPHADMMARNGIMSHDGAGDGPFLVRLEASGYGTIGGDQEIIATGATVAEVMSEWMNEPAPALHRAAILSACTEAGCASATGSDGTIYWCCDFGMPV